VNPSATSLPASVRTSRRGFTLLEASISTVIVGVMVVAALSVVGGAAKGATRERHWRRSQALATSLMSEVLAASFADPQGGATFGLDAGESHATRAGLDDVDDFDNFAEANPTDHLGAALKWADGWSRRIEVFNVDPASPSTPVADVTDTGLKLIRVIVTSPNTESRTLTALKGRVSVMTNPRAQYNVAHVTGARISLRVGASGSLLLGGATMFNTPLTSISVVPLEDD